MVKQVDPEMLAKAMNDALAIRPGNPSLPLSYRPGQVNHCPGCGRTHWWIGRTTAECAFCKTALPLAGATKSMSGRKEVIGRK